VVSKSKESSCYPRNSVDDLPRKCCTDFVVVRSGPTFVFSGSTCEFVQRGMTTGDGEEIGRIRGNRSLPGVLLRDASLC